MSDHRISTAIDRINRALARIEAQADSPRGDGAATDKHEALRRQVASSLVQLDSLIESLEE